MSDREDEISILTLNIGSPSAKRAERQLAWLSGRHESILVLSETRASAGSQLIAHRLSSAGWLVRNPVPDEGERGVLIASRVEASSPSWLRVPFLSWRADGVSVTGVDVDVFGVYVPSRDGTPAKIERKRRFVSALQSGLRDRPPRGAVLIGDLNILEPDHVPRYGTFYDWEYELYTGLIADGWVDAFRAAGNRSAEHSWVSPDGDGYRFDHVFVTRDLIDGLRSCVMLHDPRDEGFTDHSAVTLTLACGPVASRPVCESLAGAPLALF